MNVEEVQRRLWEQSKAHRAHRQSSSPLFPVNVYDGRIRNLMDLMHHPEWLAVAADPTVDGATDEMAPMAVNLAVEMGPSGRGPVQTAADRKAAARFLDSLLANLPPQGFDRFQRDVKSEYHAALAFQFQREKRPLRTARHVLRSWLAGPRHRRNRGLVKMIMRAL